MPDKRKKNDEGERVQVSDLPACYQTKKLPVKKTKDEPVVPDDGADLDGFK